MLCVLPGRLITSKLLSLQLSLLYNWRSHRHPPASLEQKEKKKRASIRSPNKPATPPKKNRYSSRRATTTSKTKQNKTNKKLEFQRDSNEREPNGFQQTTTSNQKHNPRKNAIQMFSSGHKRMAKTQRESGDRRRQRETKRDEGEKERAERRRAREPWEMRENAKETERASGARAYTTGWVQRDRIKSSQEKKKGMIQNNYSSAHPPLSVLFICVAPLTRGSVQNWCFFIIP